MTTTDVCKECRHALTTQVQDPPKRLGAKPRAIQVCSNASCVTNTSLRQVRPKPQ